MVIKMNLIRKNKGFTLIELLMALALLAMLILVLYRFFEFGHKTLNQQSNEIVVTGELRNAMDLILSECRKGITFSNADKSITCKNYIVTFRLEDNVLKMIKTNRQSLTESVTILSYSVKSISFDVDSHNVKILIRSNVKNSKGEEIFLESVYYKRTDNE